MNNNDLLRYARQIILPKFGIESQEKLQDTKVLIIGLGGLGTPASLYLSSSGIGEMTLVDFDIVTISNLSRQILYQNEDLNSLKTHVAKKKLQLINPKMNIKIIDKKLDTETLTEVINQTDIVLDCTDNFTSRYLINQTCHQTKTPLVSAAAILFSGQLTSFDFAKHSTPCYQCLYPKTQDISESTCAENGILSAVVGTMGLLQALETIKILTGLGETLNAKLLTFDGLTMHFKTLTIPPNHDCPICQIP